MVVPADPLMYFAAQNFGAGGYHVLFAVPTAVAGIVLFGIKHVFSRDIPGLLCALSVNTLLWLTFENIGINFLPLLFFSGIVIAYGLSVGGIVATVYYALKT